MNKKKFRLLSDISSEYQILMSCVELLHCLKIRIVLEENGLEIKILAWFIIIVVLIIYKLVTLVELRNLVHGLLVLVLTWSNQMKNLKLFNCKGLMGLINNKISNNNKLSAQYRENWIIFLWMHVFYARLIHEKIKSPGIILKSLCSEFRWVKQIACIQSLFFWH